MTYAWKTRLVVRGLGLTIALLLAVILLPTSGATAEDYNPHTGFLARGTYGVFPEFLANDCAACPEKDTFRTWNDKINHFDVRAFADQVAESGAGYAMFAFGQNPGLYNAPNQTWDDLLAAAGEPPRSPDRDLFGEVAKALHRRGIPVIAYLASTLSYTDTAGGKRAIGFNTAGTGPYLANIRNIAREWSERYGNLISGWWIDGLYAVHYTNADQRALVDALKAGNPHAVVAMNRYGGAGPALDFSNIGAGEDYTAGESYGSLDELLPNGCPDNSCNTERVGDGAFVNGLQWHALTWLGANGYGSTGLRYSQQQLVDYFKQLQARRGAMTFDVAISFDDPTMGQLDPVQVAALHQVRQAIGPSH